MIQARTRPLGNYFISLVSEKLDLRRSFGDLKEYNPIVSFFN
jgi:hypothetical protein